MSRRDNYGIPTALDIANAMTFAQQQVAKMKCQDPDIIKAVCEGTGATGQYAGGGTCIQWQEDKSQQTFPKPSNYFLRNCASNQDCKWGDSQMGYCDTVKGQCTCGGENKCGQGMDCLPDPTSPSNLLCGWAPDVSAGHCIFTNETACVSQGQIPYTCDNSGYCTARQSDDNSPGYTEWNIDSDGNGRCVNGNFALRMWCENPGSRCEKDKNTGDYPQMCKGSQSQRGVTDVPQFFYDKHKGQCYMTHDYCDIFGQDYNKKSCSATSDCQAGDTCFRDPKRGLGGYCVGPGSDCEESTGQKVGEFFLGKTLYYMFNKGGCETYEHPDFSEKMKRSLEKIPENACVIADPVNMDRKILLYHDFAGPGINMYMISWKNGKNFVGFTADEVEKVYPQNIQVKNGLKYICINKNEIKGDKNLKRIYFSVVSRGWITENIDNKLSGK